MKITAKNLVLENGIATYAGVRTVASEVKIPEHTELEFIDTQSRWTGTGYENDLYRVVGTDDLVIVKKNDGPVDNVCWENALLERGYFTERRNYARACGALSKKYKVPFEVALAIGTREELYPQIIAAKESFDDGELNYELCCGISRRKAAINEILGKELSCALGVDGMGQKYSSAIADFLHR